MNLPFFSCIIEKVQNTGPLGGVAQLGERYTGSVEVMGSSPTVSIFLFSRKCCKQAFPVFYFRFYVFWFYISGFIFPDFYIPVLCFWFFIRYQMYVFSYILEPDCILR